MIELRAIAQAKAINTIAEALQGYHRHPLQPSSIPYHLHSLTPSSLTTFIHSLQPSFTTTETPMLLHQNANASNIL